MTPTSNRKAVDPNVKPHAGQYYVLKVTDVRCGRDGVVLYKTYWQGYVKPTFEPLESFTNRDHPTIQAFLQNPANVLKHDNAYKAAEKIRDKQKKDCSTKNPLLLASSTSMLQAMPGPSTFSSGIPTTIQALAAAADAPLNTTAIGTLPMDLLHKPNKQKPEVGGYPMFGYVPKGAAVSLTDQNHLLWKNPFEIAIKNNDPKMFIAHRDCENFVTGMDDNTSLEWDDGYELRGFKWQTTFAREHDRLVLRIQCVPETDEVFIVNAHVRCLVIFPNKTMYILPHETLRFTNENPEQHVQLISWDSLLEEFWNGNDLEKDLITIDTEVIIVDSTKDASFETDQGRSNQSEGDISEVKYEKLELDDNFESVLSLEGTVISASHDRLGLSWTTTIESSEDRLRINVCCTSDEVFDVEGYIKLRCFLPNNTEIVKNRIVNLSNQNTEVFLGSLNRAYIEEILRKDSELKDSIRIVLDFEVHKWTVNGMTKRRDFSDRRDRSDLMLKVGQEIFYVMEDFAELIAASRTFEIPDFKAQSFQYYLETWSGLSVIDDGNLEEVLAIAKFYEDRVALDKCKGFLMNESKESWHMKFRWSIENKWMEVTEHLIDRIRSRDLINSLNRDRLEAWVRDALRQKLRELDGEMKNRNSGKTNTRKQLR